jgi:hypothetical protein
VWRNNKETEMPTENKAFVLWLTAPRPSLAGLLLLDSNYSANSRICLEPQWRKTKELEFHKRFVCEIGGVVATVVNVVVLAIAYPIYLYFEICIQAIDVNRLVK